MLQNRFFVEATVNKYSIEVHPPLAEGMWNSLSGRLRQLVRAIASRVKLAEVVEPAIIFFRGIPRVSLLRCIVLLLAVVSAVLIRLMPLRWGGYLSEFDPYRQFTMTEHLVNNGYASYFSWHDSRTWYPYGRDMATTTYPGLAYTAAVAYNLLATLGLRVSVFDFTVFFPVVFGALTTIAIYVLGRELLGKSVALVSAILLAFSSSHISRTTLGFFDDETVGIFSMLLLFSFYLRALNTKKSLRSTVIYALLSGVCLSYLASSWGAFRFSMTLVAIFSGLLVVLGRYDKRLLIAFALTYGTQFLTTMQLPFLGYLYLEEWPTYVILGVGLLIAVAEAQRRVRWKRGALGLPFGIMALTIVLLLVAWRVGLIGATDAKFISVLIPFERLQMPLIESVAEHRPATWSSFFLEFGAVAILGLFGLVLSIQRFRNNDLFMALFGVTSLYSASSLVRLTLIMAPAFILLASYAIVEFAKPSVDIIREAIIYPRRKIRTLSRVGREFGAAILLILIIALVPTFWRAVNTAYAPVTIVTGSVPTVPESGQENKFHDWIETLAWMRQNLPRDAVIFSWWDYGYWISTVGDRRSLADNGTINSTQIAVIAQTFLLNTTMAVPTLRKYDVSDVAVFFTHRGTQQAGTSYLGYGEEGKWYWMVRIGNGTRYGDYKVYFQEERAGEKTKYNRVIVNQQGKLISNQTIAEGNQLNEASLLGLLMKNGVERAQLETPNFELDFFSTNRYVFLYKVKYEGSALLRVLPQPTVIRYGETVRISGNLTDENRRAAVEVAAIRVEYSLDGGRSWVPLETVGTQPNGTFRHVWKPNAGEYLIRAKWTGKPGSFFPAVSPETSLKVNRAPVGITCEASPSALSKGTNATISCSFSPQVSGGMVKVESSLDGAKWTVVATGELIDGKFQAVWRTTDAGRTFVRIAWEGNNNYESTIGPIQTINVS